MLTRLMHQSFCFAYRRKAIDAHHAQGLAFRKVGGSIDGVIVINMFAEQLKFELERHAECRKR